MTTFTKRTTTLSTLFLIFTFYSFAQTPPSGLKGADLRGWFKDNYFKGKHTQLGYTEARKKMYNYIDNKNNSIKCVYGGYIKSWSYGGSGTNPDPINCEHTIPQSFFNEAEPMKSDIHHLFPTYKGHNATRANFPFYEINDNLSSKWMIGVSTQAAAPSSNINSYSEYYNNSFEPREDHKGNVARAVFYFYTMYPTQAGSMSKVADLNLLYQWHLGDPVDNTEIARNNAIEAYQGNRNPYIDYPDLADEAWGLSSTAPSPTYCLSKGNSVADEWIERVVLGDIDNSSGQNGGYANFTSISTPLTVGNTKTITIYPRWSGTIYLEGYSVWLDFNKDSDFEDVGERVFSRDPTTSSSVSGNFAIPTTAITGETRMRVSMKYNAIPSPCEAFEYGEVEDYTINLSDNSSLRLVEEEIIEDLTFLIFPNPAEDQVNIKYSDKFAVEILDLSGITVYKENVYNKNININTKELRPGIYIVKVANSYENRSKLLVIK